MKLIRDLEEQIEEEICDVKKYAKMAMEVRDDHPGLAQVLFNIALQEDGHQAALHAEIVKIIEEHRRDHGEPPAAMMAVYEYLHKKHIDKLAEARMYLEMYKKA